MNHTDPSAKASVQPLERGTRWHIDSTEDLYDEPAKASTQILSARMSQGNHLRVLQDGTETLPAMFDAIRSARRYVHLEYYVIEDVHVGGESLFDLLIAKCRSGVQIAIKQN